MYQNILPNSQALPYSAQNIQQLKKLLDNEFEAFQISSTLGSFDIRNFFLT